MEISWFNFLDFLGYFQNFLAFNFEFKMIPDLLFNLENMERQKMKIIPNSITHR